MVDEAKSEQRLLVIDSNSTRRGLIVDFLSRKYKCEDTDNTQVAIDKINAREFGVILASFSMSSLQDKDFVSLVQKITPRSIIILISDEPIDGNTVRAFRAGAFEVIQKPFELKKIEMAIDRAFAQYELKSLKDRYQTQLEELVAARTKELDTALEEIENAYRMTLRALVQALETRDFETHGHSERVVTFCLRLGYEMRLDKNAMRDLELGALLHDIGKIGVPDAILRKPAHLDEEEWNKMKLHPLHGQRIIRNIEFLEGAGRVIAQHHERWDGSGYPLGLRGEEIDMGARIFAVVDTFDAMVSDRVYRKGCSYEDVVKELEQYSGVQFDPAIVEIFKQIPKEDWEILREHSMKKIDEDSSFQSIVTNLVNSRQQLMFNTLG